MSQISPQVDVGAPTLNGLAAFAPVLATLSADEVMPMAMVQMENLGSLFHINGKYALQVPDLLQRCKSTRLDRLGLLVGWRKGDAASLMAQSAGGQAISLLSMCIVNLYGDSHAGILLSGLSKNMLSQTIATASPLQLVKVARTISSKLQVLGFGNILAAQVVRIYDAYKYFGTSVPDNFLDVIVPEQMAELLHAIARAVREESIVVRITGSQSMGHILAIVMIMFPEDALVTMENVIVFEGLRKSILVEFTDSDGIIDIRIESKLQIQSALSVRPLAKQSHTKYQRFYCYEWNGCMADMLQVMFMEDGLICNEPLRVACCRMLEPLSKVLGNTKDQFNDTGPLGNHGVIKLLGPYPHERIDQVCQRLWRLPPGWARPPLSLKGAFDDLVLAFDEATLAVSCICKLQTRCSTKYGWKDHHYESRIPHRSRMRWCPLYRLWTAVGVAIGYGFGCLFVNAGDGATMSQTVDIPSDRSIQTIIWELLDPKCDLHDIDATYGYCKAIESCIINLVGPATCIAASSTSSTVYMAALQTPHLPNTMNAPFILTEGQLIFSGRYHTSLEAVGSDRSGAETDIHQGTQPIIPSSAGEHSSLEMTILECVHYLELTVTIVVGGSIVRPDLERIILASWDMDEANPCKHLADTPLEPQHKDAVLTTSVAAPSTIDGKISIVQVSRNPVAQLLACS
ncbi:hypothetical protein VE03_08900 [Pseudogymnoascus sp. 23342-1-I1]|nr:hypothetical protein VE03_08900 [Pseudogymnoascus sp. 23342-1-I1]